MESSKRLNAGRTILDLVNGVYDNQVHQQLYDYICEYAKGEESSIQSTLDEIQALGQRPQIGEPRCAIARVLKILREQFSNNRDRYWLNSFLLNTKGNSRKHANCNYGQASQKASCCTQTASLKNTTQDRSDTNQLDQEVARRSQQTHRLAKSLASHQKRTYDESIESSKQKTHLETKIRMFVQTREMQDRVAASPVLQQKQKINPRFTSPKSSLSSQQINVKYEVSPIKLQDMIADYSVPQEFIDERSLLNSKSQQRQSQLKKQIELEEVSTISDDVELLRKSLSDSENSLSKFKKSLVLQDRQLCKQQISQLQQQLIAKQKQRGANQLLIKCYAEELERVPDITLLYLIKRMKETLNCDNIIRNISLFTHKYAQIKERQAIIRKNLAGLKFLQLKYQKAELLQSCRDALLQKLITYQQAIIFAEQNKIRLAKTKQLLAECLALQQRLQ